MLFQSLKNILCLRLFKKQPETLFKKKTPKEHLSVVVRVGIGDVGLTNKKAHKDKESSLTKTTQTTNNNLCLYSLFSFCIGVVCVGIGDVGFVIGDVGVVACRC